ncbi:hypothetical protein MHYP_G00088320 [Metynnis hypsauchen]
MILCSTCSKFGDAEQVPLVSTQHCSSSDLNPEKPDHSIITAWEWIIKLSLIPTLERNARISLRGQLTASRGNPVTPRTKPSSEHHANLQADWQRRAASLQAPLSGSPRRNLKLPSLTPRHPLTTDSSPEGLPAPKLHPRVGKRPKLDINSDASLSSEVPFSEDSKSGFSTSK